MKEHTKASSDSSHSAFAQALCVFCGSSLLMCILSIALLSRHFEYGEEQLDCPIILVVTILGVAGALYLVSVACVRRIQVTKHLLLWAVGLGIALRAILFYSTPICETDFYRYMWDGAVLAQGYNPYAYSQNEIIEEDESGDVPDELKELALQSGDVIYRVNHPDLGTIYPPVTEAVFAVAYFILPWNINSLRFVFFIFDGISIFLLIQLLRRLNLSPLYVVIYWWNPILLKEVYNSAHMDVILVPLLLGTIILVLDGKYLRAAVFLALATATKVWPIILLPVMFRPLLSLPRKLVAALLIFAIVLCVLLVPVLGAKRLGGDSGILAYSERWEMNDSLYMVFEWSAKKSSMLLGHEPTRNEERIAGRVLMLVVLAGIIMKLALKKTEDNDDFCRRLMWCAAALFLLSPTQFPWYYIWLLPFLVLTPRYSLLMLSVTLPLYYLRFYFKSRGEVKIFDDGIVWLEFAPVLFMLLIEYYMYNRKIRRLAQPEIVENA